MQFDEEALRRVRDRAAGKERPGWPLQLFQKRPVKGGRIAYEPQTKEPEE